MKVKLEAAPPVNNVSLKASTADAGRVGNNICSIHIVQCMSSCVQYMSPECTVRVITILYLPLVCVITHCVS